MKIKPLPSLEYLNECFTLDETCPSGLRWKVRPQSHFPTIHGWISCRDRIAHKMAGSLTTFPDGHKYWQVGICNKNYYVHRIIYAMFHDTELAIDIEIDHKSGDGSNNSPDNIRLATHNHNQHNKSMRKDNTSGIKGVSWNKRKNAWCGQVMHKGKNYTTGYSPSKEIIGELVRELREKLHRDFCHHGE